VKFKLETEFQDTEIGKIPKEWKIMKLRDIAIKVKMGGTPKRSVKEYWNGDIPFAKIEDVTGARKYLLNTASTITKSGLENSNAWLVPVNSLLITIYGTLGAVAINKIETATNQAIVGIVPNNELVDIEFLYYWYLRYQSKWVKFVKKSTQPNLTLEIVANSKVPLPSINEQRRIAEILSTVDRVIESVDVAIARLEGLKKALMSVLLSGRIRVKEENNKLVFYRETDFQGIETGKIPREWKIVKLKDVVELRKEIADPTQVDPSTPYVGLEHVDSGDIELKRYGKAEDVKSTKLKFYKRDILYGKLRPYLDKAVISHLDGVCSTDFIVMKTRHNVKPEYLIWVLHTNEFIKYATQTMKGTNHPRTSWESLASYALGLPPINEQELIAYILDNIVRLKDLYIREKGKLDRLKRGLMDLLLSGRVRVLE